MPSTTAAAATRPVAEPEGAARYVLDPAHSEVSFQVRHLVTRARGRFQRFSAELEGDPAFPEAARIRFTIASDSIDTNEPDRDKHLRSADFFDVEKYPEIVFESSGVRPRGGDRYDVAGTLTIRGVSRPITVPVEFLGFAKDPWGNEKAGFEAQFKINRKEFGIEFNAVLDNGGLLLGDEAAVTASLQFKREA